MSSSAATVVRPEMLAADHIRELTQGFTTTEKRVRLLPIPTTARPLARHGWTPDPTGVTELHPVTHPPLLDQIRSATPGSSALSDESATHRATSKPAAHLEALDLLARIEAQSAALADEHGIDESTLTKRLARLSGFIGHQPHRLVRSWWTAARVVTQHDAPAYRPHGTPCPVCWDTASLRIRVADELAHCTTCTESWDTTGDLDTRPLALLAQHVRWCTDHAVTKPRHWRTDPTGELVECTECLDFREAWATWRAEQTAAAARGA